MLGVPTELIKTDQKNMPDEQAEPTQIKRLHFLGWQCRLRQHSIRTEEGRPSSGMRPEVSVAGKSLGTITVLVVKAEPDDMTAQFRYMVKKTPDPAERFENAIKVLAEAYYQRPKEFSDEMTALFGPGSRFAQHLINQGDCELHFDQFSQSYRLPCRVEALRESHSHYQATFWHNSLFNHEIPGGAVVLGFKPDWERAVAEPDVG